MLSSVDYSSHSLNKNFAFLSLIQFTIYKDPTDLSTQTKHTHSHAMHSTLLTSPAVALFLATVNAIPTDNTALVPRDSAPTGENLWTASNNQGNTKIGFSNTKVNFGNRNPVDIINNNVTSTCGTFGTCQDGQSEDIGLAETITNQGLVQGKLSYTATGAYPTWIHNGLLDTMAAALEKVVNKTSNVCTEMAPGGTAVPSQVCFDQYSGPTSVAIVYDGSTDKDAAPPFIEVNFSIDNGEDGLCPLITTMGSTISGAIGAPTGGLFSLAALFCNQ